LNIKNKLPETVQVFENIDFMSKYCQGLEKYLNTELKSKIATIKSTASPEKILINCIKAILDYHKSQNNFFLELSQLDRFFSSMYSKFQKSFIHLVKHTVFHQLDYERHFGPYFRVVFEDYKLNIVKHFTQKMLELDNNTYA
jgi:hypothetical protein